MKKANVFMHGIAAGLLEEILNGYRFTYRNDYQGPPISLTMPIKQKIYEFKVFPPFFEGLLPEGIQLQALLKKYKLDQKDLMSQLIQVGGDLVGAVTVEEFS